MIKCKSTGRAERPADSSLSHLEWRSPLPEINSNTRVIPLTQGKVAIVDAEDFERVSRHSWHYHAANRTNTKWYARARIDGNMVLLHRFILGVPPDKVTDHRNRDGLDCRRQNIRICTRSQNACNVAARRTNKTGFKGVQMVKDGRYVVMLRVKDPLAPRGQRDYYGGIFETAEAAARAHDALAAQYHREFASLNFPDEEPITLTKRPYNATGTTINGQTLTLAEWSRRSSLSISSVRSRLRRGWAIERALNLK